MRGNEAGKDLFELFNNAVFGKDLVGVHMVEPVLGMNRPIQVGFAILDMSCMIFIVIRG